MFTKAKNGIHICAANGLTVSLALREDYNREELAAIMVYDDHDGDPVNFRSTAATGYELLVTAEQLPAVLSLVSAQSPFLSAPIDLPAHIADTLLIANRAPSHATPYVSDCDRLSAAGGSLGCRHTSSSSQTSRPTVRDGHRSSA